MNSGASLVDFSLRGDDLDAWEQWLASEKQQEWLLTWGIRVNKVAVRASLPLWMLATILRIPLSFVSLFTGGLIFWPLHRLLVRPLTFAVVVSSEVWTKMPAVRPLLLLLCPLQTTVGMTVISLIPDGNPDHLSARLILCELWPLTYRRLQWIAEHRPAQVSSPAA